VAEISIPSYSVIRPVQFEEKRFTWFHVQKLTLAGRLPKVNFDGLLGAKICKPMLILRDIETHWRIIRPATPFGGPVCSLDYCSFRNITQLPHYVMDRGDRYRRRRCRWRFSNRATVSLQFSLTSRAKSECASKRFSFQSRTEHTRKGSLSASCAT
jgi:hypothetical protein